MLVCAGWIDLFQILPKLFVRYPSAACSLLNKHCVPSEKRKMSELRHNSVTMDRQ